VTAAPVRVLQVVGGLDRAGVETWLRNVLATVDPAEVKLDFLVHRAREGHYEPEVRALGAEVLRCLAPRRPVRYVRELAALVRRGRYDVVHTHTQLHGALALLAARLAGVPVRVAHAHLAEEPSDRRWPRRAYVVAARRAAGALCTRGLAVSAEAGRALFGERWGSDPRLELHHSAIDLAPFERPVDGARARAGLGLPAGALVVGHVGRFEPQKNHEAVLRIFARVAARVPRARLLLAGDGPLRPAVEARARDLGVGDAVSFLGSRGDVPALLAAMDVLLFPSRYEGLGLVVLEARAAGVPAVVSSAVPPEAREAPGLVTVVALEAPDERWAEAVLAAPPRTAALARRGLDALRGSPYDVRVSARELAARYVRWVEGARRDARSQVG
jgi:glycosyltransferase involved in cell wall biosynthesis